MPCRLGITCLGRRGRSGPGGAGRRTEAVRRGRWWGRRVLDIPAEGADQLGKPAVEALPDGRDPPDPLTIEITDDDGAFAGEIRAGERVTQDLAATDDDPEITR